MRGDVSAPVSNESAGPIYQHCRDNVGDAESATDTHYQHAQGEMGYVFFSGVAGEILTGMRSFFDAETRRCFMVVIITCESGAVTSSNRMTALG